MKSIWIKLALFCVVLVPTSLALVTYSVWKKLPDVSILTKNYPHLKISQRGKAPSVEFKPMMPQHWVSLAHISDRAIGAIIVSEDWAFYQHDGFDALQLRKVLEDAWRSGRVKRGASTITQQVAKNLFLSREKTIKRKITEILLAYQLEKAISKKKILEIYLNIAEWGRDIYGIQKASQLYFSKPPAELRAKEGAYLAMLLPSPVRYSRSFWEGKLSVYAQNTIHNILGKMKQAHFLTPEDYQLAKQEDLLVSVPVAGGISQQIMKLPGQLRAAEGEAESTELPGIDETELELEEEFEIEVE